MSELPSQPMTATAKHILAVLSLLFLSGCYEPASTWSEKQGRYRPTDEVRREQINAEIDKRNAQADCKSGAGCCRPRVQDGDPKIECTDDDWMKP